jgi:hypothetical protein
LLTLTSEVCRRRFNEGLGSDVLQSTTQANRRRGGSIAAAPNPRQSKDEAEMSAAPQHLAFDGAAETPGS